MSAAEQIKPRMSWLSSMKLKLSMFIRVASLSISAAVHHRAHVVYIILLTFYNVLVTAILLCLFSPAVCVPDLVHV